MKRLIMLAAIVLGFAVAAHAAVNDPATFTISDGPLSYLLGSDGSGVYVDWRLPDNDPCVFSWVATSGLFFAYLDRGNDLGEDCQAMFPPEKWRTYNLTFPAGTGICKALGFIDEPCLLVTDDKPRMAFDKLFAARTKETPGRLMFYLDGKSYQLECAGEIAGSGNIRTVSNSVRTAVLKLISGKKPQQIGVPFVFPFSMTVTRVPQ